MPEPSPLTVSERENAEATFKRLNVIFRDDRIDEIALTPNSADQLYHEAGKLALSTGVIPLLSKYCQYLLGSVYSRCFGAGGESTGPARVLLSQLTRALLLMCANNYTAWNHRKRLVVAGGLDAADDLAFNCTLLAFHTKADHAWAHRRWLLTRLRDAGRPLDYARELALCNRVAVVRRRNYYAWAHRCWLLDWLPADLLLGDIDYTHRFHHANIGDWSCLCYRLSAFARVGDRDQLRSIVEQELAFVDDQAQLHPDIPHLKLFAKQCRAMIAMSNEESDLLQ